MDRLGTAAGSIGTLEDDLRRRMYFFIRKAGRPIARDEAAAEVGISRKLAAFHLDKLVEKGLLVAHYARPPGRSGPGAGRSAKYYEPSEAEFGVSLPHRGYDVVGTILVDAITQSDKGVSAKQAARSIAFERGRALGEQVRNSSKLRRPGSERALSVAEEVLEENGYEPYRDDSGSIRLRNCPFHELSRRSPELVCGLNREFIDGLLRGLGNESVTAELDPQPGQCCVRLHAPE
jgi:predicted ArsR family transcriptional regulator